MYLDVLRKYRRPSILEGVEDLTPHDDSLETMTRRLKALADPARLRIVHLLSRNTGSPVCVCSFVEPLGLSQPTVSHHLKVLTDAGITAREKHGTWAYFTLVDPSMEDHLAAFDPKRTQ
jgi:ArsR family transcriptional regulator